MQTLQEIYSNEILPLSEELIDRDIAQSYMDTHNV